MSNTELVHAYRNLYRKLLHAVRFSSKARGTVRDQLRTGFRDKNGTFDAEAIKRTGWFLEAAARERGLEHKVLKNLIHTHWARDQTIPWRHRIHELRIHEANSSTQKRHFAGEEAKANAFNHYDMTIAMLNKSMGLCLR